jgi:preprotein translocase subunit SecE
VTDKVTATTIMFRFIAPTNTGGLPIESYAVEYKETTQQWQDARRRVWPSSKWSILAIIVVGGVVVTVFVVVVVDVVVQYKETTQQWQGARRIVWPSSKSYNLVLIVVVVVVVIVLVVLLLLLLLFSTRRRLSSGKAQEGDFGQ